MGKAFHTLIVQDQVDETTVMLDSTTVKVHQYCGGDKKSYDQETGRCRRGLTTKVHVVDG